MPRRVADLTAVRAAGATAALLVLAGLGLFWGGTFAAAAVNPGYSHGRDYVSVLAARGAEHGWLGVVAIAAAGAAMLAAGVLLSRISRAAALAVALAGIGFVVVSLTRLECSNGAARCGIGGRFEISGSTEVSHWTAATVSSILVIAGISLAGLALLRAGRRVPAVLSLGAAAVTAAAFLATGGETPGAEQRVGIVAGTGWLAAVAILALVRRRE